MHLFIVQHGQAMTDKEDPTRPLSSDGVNDSEKMARWLAASQIEVDQIWHSGKKRAEQTASIFAEHLSPQQGVTATSGLNPMDDVRPIAKQLEGLQHSVMIVGHLPFLSYLVGLLLSGNPERELVRIQNSGVLCLNDDKGRWLIKWQVIPDLVED
jgi:phosphohistidine phosphatase